MKQINIDEYYSFGCTCCGDCCSGNMKIHINLFDLFKIAVRLGFSSTGTLFSANLIKLVQGQNGAWIPIINFKKKPFPFCPWLINEQGDDDVLRGFCSLHPHDKPLVCKMAPVGRVADLTEGTESYILTAPTENCPGMVVCEENRLSVMKKELRQELDFELRFFAILEKMEGMPQESYKKLYLLDCAVPFEKQLKDLESAYEI
ncbi:hypothetical protein [Spirochaeta isovalerica]|uniref:Fe-S-cluster containining protein n=1 Tax=Spirochaeta isovalerica TaxID=150 RepID=A0A841RBL2_9SPIO|nr:hypothetical protein [Spirochaeta isovalerica]MBB6481323.1 Fe-S-cluster containining protein [Spirochaeta isovalerica]